MNRNWHRGRRLGSSSGGTRRVTRKDVAKNTAALKLYLLRQSLYALETFESSFREKVQAALRKIEQWEKRRQQLVESLPENPVPHEDFSYTSLIPKDFGGWTHGGTWRGEKEVGWLGFGGPTARATELTQLRIACNKHRDKCHTEYAVAVKRYETEKARQDALLKSQLGPKPKVPVHPSERFHPCESFAAILSEAVSEKRKSDLLVARAARNKEEARARADAVRATMVVDHACPYCGRQLDGQVHFDHIYPLAKGGLSVVENMVAVCVACNMKKSDMTLQEFMKVHQLVREVVESRLDALGKKY